MRHRLFIPAATALLIALTACTQDELADDNRLPEGEYPVVIRATGLSVERQLRRQPHPPVPPWTATGRAYRPWHSRWATR